MLLGFILSILAFFIGGNDERLILVRESFVTGVLGMVFLFFLFFSKPLIYHFALKFLAGDNANKKAAFKEGWSQPYFRFILRLMTAVWGFALLGEAVIKVILVYELSVFVFLAVSQLIFYSVLGVTILWTIVYRKHANKRLELIKQEKVAIDPNFIETT